MMQLDFFSEIEPKNLTWWQAFGILFAYGEKKDPHEAGQETPSKGGSSRCCEQAVSESLLAVQPPVNRKATKRRLN